MPAVFDKKKLKYGTGEMPQKALIFTPYGLQTDLNNNYISHLDAVSPPVLASPMHYSGPELLNVCYF